MSENTDNRNRDTTGIDVVLVVLESGHSVELPATGYSMFPTLRPGDRVVVRPLSEGELPERGSVVVFIDKGVTAQGHNGITAQGSELRAQGREYNNILVMHRLVEIKNDDSGNLMYITRGDSMMEPDKPWPQEQIVGVAVSSSRGKKEHLIKCFVPESWRYKYNRRLLWIISMNKILTRVLNDLVRKKRMQ
jgi:signal peptidase I